MEYSQLIKNINMVIASVDAAKARAGRTDNVIIVGASKTMSSEVIEMVDKCGLLNALGENKVQEFGDKFSPTHKFDWHFIGTLQSKKVRLVVGKVKLIESVDNIKLAESIAKFAQTRTTCQEILLQVNMGREESKFGFLPEEIEQAIATVRYIYGVSVVGIMAVMPIAPEAELIELYKELNALYCGLKDKYNLKYLSAGMSNDYELAVQYGGANIIRIGRAIFGERV